MGNNNNVIARHYSYNAIKAMRKRAGMTQKAFSEYFGIPQRTIENWEGEQRQCPEYVKELIRYKLEKEGVLKV